MAKARCGLIVHIGTARRGARRKSRVQARVGCGCGPSSGKLGTGQRVVRLVKQHADAVARAGDQVRRTHHVFELAAGAREGGRRARVGRRGEIVRRRDQSAGVDGGLLRRVELSVVGMRTRVVRLLDLTSQRFGGRVGLRGGARHASARVAAGAPPAPRSGGFCHARVRRYGKTRCRVPRDGEAGPSGGSSRGCRRQRRLDGRRGGGPLRGAPLLKKRVFAFALALRTLASRGFGSRGWGRGPGAWRGWGCGRRASWGGGRRCWG